MATFNMAVSAAVQITTSTSASTAPASGFNIPGDKLVVTNMTSVPVAVALNDPGTGVAPTATVASPYVVLPGQQVMVAVDMNRYLWPAVVPIGTAAATSWVHFARGVVA